MIDLSKWLFLFKKRIVSFQKYIVNKKIYNNLTKIISFLTMLALICTKYSTEI